MSRNVDPDFPVTVNSKVAPRAGQRFGEGGGGDISPARGNVNVMKTIGAGGTQSKASPRDSGRKKGTATGESVSQQRRDENKKPRSASVGSSLTPTKPRAALEQKQQNKIPLCSNRGVAGKVAIGLVDAGEGEAGALPPRSPVNKAPKTANNNNTRPNKQQQPPQQGMKVQGPTLEDALDDVQVRFVLNLPEAELSSADRLFFQLEQAWWFYEDFIADAHSHLPHFRLKEFAKLMFEHCAALRPLSAKYNELFEHFKSWKGTIPTAGCILLNAEMTKLVLVKCWKGNSRGLPKGKINQGEPSIAAAVREVMEETGYDAASGANEKDCLTLYVNGQQTTMYIVTGVDEGFRFEPQVRKEVSAVEWFPLDALPKSSFGVEPFMFRLKRWMAKASGKRVPKEASAEARTQSTIRLRNNERATSPDVRTAAAAVGAVSQSIASSPAAQASPETTPKKQNRKGPKGAVNGGGGAADALWNSSEATVPKKGASGRANSAPSRRAKGYDAHNRDTFGGGAENQTGGVSGGRNIEGWDFESMLAANERITGRTFTYDGNPHEFGDPVPAPAASGATESAAAAAARPVAAPPRQEDQVGHLKARGSALHVTHMPQHQLKQSTAGSSLGLAAASSGKPTGLGAHGGLAPPSRAETAGEDGLGIYPEVIDSLCIEGASGTEGQSVAIGSFDLWGSAAASTSTSVPAGGNGGLFGEFKFDLLDIMNAVPQG